MWCANRPKFLDDAGSEMKSKKRNYILAASSHNQFRDLVREATKSQPNINRPQWRTKISETNCRTWSLVSKYLWLSSTLFGRKRKFSQCTENSACAFCLNAGQTSAKAHRSRTIKFWKISQKTWSHKSRVVVVGLMHFRRVILFRPVSLFDAKSIAKN